MPTPRAPLPCTDRGDLYFSEYPHDLESAKTLCRSCPVQPRCLEGAITRRERFGVWGGQIFVEGNIVARKRARGRPAAA